MMVIILVYLFILGMVLGSFYNVVASRLPKNESIISPGSHCENCNHKLTWYELIPVFSYIFQGGKCSKCKIKLSILYPLSELVTGILFVLSYVIFGASYQMLMSLVVVSVVVITVISDFKYMVILDEPIIIGSIMIFILLFFDGGLVYLGNSMFHGIVLLVIMVLIKLFGDKLFKRESLGWGDVKLSFLAGLLLGVRLGAVYIFLSSVIALPYAIYITCRKKDSVVPFGPFLAISMLIIYWNSSFVFKILGYLLGV